MPASVPIPAWNAQGLLPAMDRADPTSSHRSPYLVTLGDVVMRFGSNSKRTTIIQGFLDYRSALHAAGLADGFQWLDGSFVEHLEIGSRQRPPNDIDVVTFFRLSGSSTLAEIVERSPELFPSDASEQQALKDRYKVDAYTVNLGQNANRLVDRSVYWYGLWAHQRDTFTWKGFLQIDLSPSDDAIARALLASLLRVTQ